MHLRHRWEYFISFRGSDYFPANQSLSSYLSIECPTLKACFIQLLHCTESRLLVKQYFLGSCLGYPDLRSLNKLLFSAWVAVSVQRKHPLKVLLPLMLSSRALLYGGQACLDCFSLFSIFTAVMRVIAWYPEYNLFFHDTHLLHKNQKRGWLTCLLIVYLPNSMHITFQFGLPRKYELTYLSWS